MSGAWNLKRIVFLLPLAALAGTAFAADKSERYGKNPENLETHLDRLVAAYPETIQGFDKEALTLRDGTRLPLSDGRENKSFDAWRLVPIRCGRRIQGQTIAGRYWDRSCAKVLCRRG